MNQKLIAATFFMRIRYERVNDNVTKKMVDTIL